MEDFRERGRKAKVLRKLKMLKKACSGKRRKEVMLTYKPSSCVNYCRGGDNRKEKYSISLKD